jgi:hypothetical protein
MATGLTNLSRLRLTGDDTEETILQATDGVTKIHTRPAAGGYSLEVKSEPTIVTGTHFGIEATVDAIPSTATSAAGIRGAGAIGRLKATYTMTSGSLIGAYGQACNNCTLNGSGVMVAGTYSLLADGGTYTAVSHAASLWVDSQLAQTVTAGNAELIYATNNGATTLGNAIYIYAGNKITNLFTIDTASGMVGDKVNGDYTFTATRKIKVVAGGETGYLIMDIS